MKTSWNNVRITEQYLDNQLDPEDQLVFEAQLLINPILKVNVLLQKKIHSLVKMYGRKQLKSEILQLEQALFQSAEKAEFQQRVTRIFKD